MGDSSLRGGLMTKDPARSFSREMKL
ncbi:MAG: hypothetical protein JWP35_3066, partial [Caulobacter sp.]|nr:hypothetical protein [Caulobacter sp.]